MTNRAEAFARWLTRKGYRPRTVDKTVSDLRSYLKNNTIIVGARTVARWEDYRRAYRLYKEFADLEGFRVPAPQPEYLAERPEVNRGERRERRRKKPALSIDENEWKRLRKAVKRDDLPESRVLEVMLATGLRVGDVLRVTPEAIEGALKRQDGLFTIELKGGKVIRYPVGGAEEEWTTLHRALRNGRHPHAAHMVSGQKDPETRGAYFKVRDRFVELCEACSLTGRTHLHRIRRTVAVRLLNRGVSLYDVQQLLGHEDLRTTQRYTDEWSAGRMIDAIKKNRD